MKEAERNSEKSERPLQSEHLPPDIRLDSWKEISEYLRRTVRTVQRWEQNEGLPVHRIAHEKRSTVFAYRSELDAWWLSRQASRNGRPAALQPAAPAPAERSLLAVLRRAAQFAWIAALLLAVVLAAVVVARI